MRTLLRSLIVSSVAAAAAKAVRQRARCASRNRLMHFAIFMILIFERLRSQRRTRRLWAARHLSTEGRLGGARIGDIAPSETRARTSQRSICRNDLVHELIVGAFLADRRHGPFPVGLN